MSNTTRSTTARLTAIDGYLSSPSDRVDLSPPIDLRLGAEVFWNAYIAQRQPHEWSQVNLAMLRRLSELCQLYAEQFVKMADEEPISYRASGAPFVNPRYSICQDLLNKIGTLEAFMGLQSKNDSAAAKSARLVNSTVAGDSDELLG